MVKIAAKSGRDPVKNGRLFLVIIDDMEVAFRVTKILDVIEVKKEDIEDSKPELPVSGILIRDGKPVMLLDLDRVLPKKERKLIRALY